MFDKDLEWTLLAAEREAEERRHEFVCAEHLLFALLHNNDAAKIIKTLGGDINKLKSELEQFFS